MPEPPPVITAILPSTRPMRSPLSSFCD
jgi:hypothetical protein